MNFSLPTDSVAYVHRAGRAGRAGSKGECIIMYSSSNRDQLLEIQRDNMIEFIPTECPSKEIQREQAIDAVIQDALSRRESLNMGTLYESFIGNLSETDKATIVATCLHGILGSSLDIQVARNSILSGKAGFSPILFVDPGRTNIKSQTDLSHIFDIVGVVPGLIAQCESGYVVDVPTADAIRIVFDKSGEFKSRFGIEVILLDKLPNLKTDQVNKGRKFNRPLPWRLQK